MDLSTNYLGLKLKSPVIIGSSGLTDTVEKIAALEKYGAGAVVLKSIFEEEITLEYEKILEEEASTRYKDDYLDYFDYKIKQDNLNKYINLIVETKKKVEIPVIGSINCTSSHEWTYFARQIQKAGADAIELNIFINPAKLDLTHDKVIQTFLEIISNLKNEIKIPVSIKMSCYFTNLANTIETISRTGIKGIVLFNRFYSPDIDIDNMEITATNVLSSPDDLSRSLRWIGIMANRVKCDLVGSTGIHNGSAVIKELLAGANAVQIVSSLYENGPEYLETILEDVKSWMEKKGYKNIDDFRGKMSQEKYVNPALYERVQFMKYFSDKK